LIALKENKSTKSSTWTSKSTRENKLFECRKTTLYACRRGSSIQEGEESRILKKRRGGLDAVVKTTLFEGELRVLRHKQIKIRDSVLVKQVRSRRGIDCLKEGVREE